MNSRRGLIAIAITLATNSVAQPAPWVSRAEILKLVGLTDPTKNPDIQPGLHAAKPHGNPGPLKFDPSEFPAGFKGQVICQLFIDTDGKVERVEALYGPAALKKSAIAYSHRWNFQPETTPGSLYSIFLCLDYKFKEGRAYTVDAFVSATP